MVLGEKHGTNYLPCTVLLLRHLLISFHRELTREHILKNKYLDN